MALSEAGHTDLAFASIMAETMPSYGYMLANGSTTTWEGWFFSDSTFSHDHPAFGSVEVYMMQALGGIQPHPAANGFDHVLIKPRPPANLSHFAAHYNSIRGMIAVEWAWVEAHDETPGARKLQLSVELPPNVMADVFVPTASGTTVVHGSRETSARPGHETTVFQRWSGVHQFTSWARLLKTDDSIDIDGAPFNNENFIIKKRKNATNSHRLVKPISRSEDASQGPARATVTTHARWLMLRNFSGEEIVDVTAFGARGDGKNDDTASIQAALDAGVGKLVFFPHTGRSESQDAAYVISATLETNKDGPVAILGGAGTEEAVFIVWNGPTNGTMLRWNSGWSRMTGINLYSGSSLPGIIMHIGYNPSRTAVVSIEDVEFEQGVFGGGEYRVSNIKTLSGMYINH